MTRNLAPPTRQTTTVESATVRLETSDSVQVVAVDDDPMALRVLARSLEKSGYQTLAIDNGETALEVVSGETAVALLDLRMPGLDGMDCLRFIRQHYPDTQVIILTGSDEVQDAVEAMREGAFEYLTKPYEEDDLLVHVGKAVEAWSMRRENQGLRETLSINVPAAFAPAQSHDDDRLAENVSRIAKLDSTVLIGGESGTGKSTVARMIHQNGPRCDGPFVAVNCASLPRDLIESELFGHSKGAFTGAVKDRPGRAEVANGGTLFLDEIGDLPIELQPKLLTFLQDRTVQRIGSNEVKKVDVRLIVATHRDLAAMCETNRFRQDLYYRLNVLRMEMPPLRERADEIPMLVANILSRISERQKRQGLQASDEALLALADYPWPGNIRELENVLERAAAFCDEGRIDVNDLMFDAPATSSLDGREEAETHPQGRQNQLGSSLAGRTLEEIERLALEQTLLHCHGNKAKTARMLGISEKSVYNKMRRLGIHSVPANRETVK